ncbi:MAG: hypothetical protein Q9190_002363 [Brigantiaea leucoxantha]
MNVVKSERKPRRNIQYKDIANAVARIDNLEFLSDVIPKTTTYREYKDKKSKSKRPHASLQSGQTTLDGTRSLPTRLADAISSGGQVIGNGDDASDNTVNDPSVAVHEPQTNGQFVFEHYEPNGQSRRDESGDVVMD